MLLSACVCLCVLSMGGFFGGREGVCVLSLPQSATAVDYRADNRHTTVLSKQLRLVHAQQDCYVVCDVTSFIYK